MAVGRRARECLCLALVIFQLSFDFASGFFGTEDCGLFGNERAFSSQPFKRVHERDSSSSEGLGNRQHLRQPPPPFASAPAPPDPEAVKSVRARLANRIVNGYLVRRHRPWMVRIARIKKKKVKKDSSRHHREKRGDEKVKTFCGGSIITTWYIKECSKSNSKVATSAFLKKYISFRVLISRFQVSFFLS